MPRAALCAGPVSPVIPVLIQWGGVSEDVEAMSGYSPSSLPPGPWLWSSTEGQSSPQCHCFQGLVIPSPLPELELVLSVSSIHSSCSLAVMAPV